MHTRKDHQGNKPNQNEISPHTWQNGYCKTDEQSFLVRLLAIVAGIIAGNVNWCGHYGKLWRFLKKIKRELSYDLAIPFLGICPEEMKTLTWKGICTLIFKAGLFTEVKTWKQLKCPSMEKWIKKMQHHIHNAILHSHKKRMKSCHL